MANLLATGSAWLAGVLRTHAGGPVSYLQHDGPGFAIDATRGQTEFAEDPNAGRGATVVRSADFLVDPAAFRAAAGRWPEDGDRVQVAAAIDGVADAVYRVSSFSGQPCYRLDPQTSVLRIHAREDSES